MDKLYKEELMSDDNIRNCKKTKFGLFQRNGVDRKELWETGYEYPCHTETASMIDAIACTRLIRHRRQDIAEEIRLP